MTQEIEREMGAPVHCAFMILELIHGDGASAFIEFVKGLSLLVPHAHSHSLRCYLLPADKVTNGADNKPHPCIWIYYSNFFPEKGMTINTRMYCMVLAISSLLH